MLIGCPTVLSPYMVSLCSLPVVNGRGMLVMASLPPYLRHDDTRSENMDQFDLNIAIRHMVCPGVIDLDLYDVYNRKDELHNIIIQ